MLVGCLAVLIAASGFITEVPAMIRAKLVSTNEIRGAFIMEKNGGGVFISRGTYQIRPERDFTWHVTEPFDAVFFATPEQYTYSNEDETVTRELKSLPGFNRLADAANGDFTAFFEAFDALYKEEDGRFYLKAKPKREELAHLLDRVEAEGEGGRWTLRVAFPNETSFRIDFIDGQ